MGFGGLAFAELPGKKGLKFGEVVDDEDDGVCVCVSVMCEGWLEGQPTEQRASKST